MEMSSFYGGRTGASFVIVKRFDGVDIPEGTATRSSYATDVNGFPLLSETLVEGAVSVGSKYLIKKTAENYLDYDYWKVFNNDGSAILTAAGESGYIFPTEMAQGMIQYFRKGAGASREVNYGEYVLIDTVSGMHEYNNPDNGKVYRRGMDITNELAGAEYIGQIVGPQGDSPILELDSYDETAQKRGTYTADNEDLIPGTYYEGDEQRFNDEILWSSKELIDEFGRITGCIIGFRIPTLVEDFVGESVTPYSVVDRTELLPGGSYDIYNFKGLVNRDSEEYNEVTKEWKHPFYQKWQIKVPHGYHGVNCSNLEIIPTATMPENFKEAGFPGARIFSDPECRTAVTNPATGRPIYLTSSRYILLDEDYDSSPSVISAKLEYNGDIVYVRKDECYMDIVRYREINFDRVEEGETTYHNIGEYNDIERITLSKTGIITVYYSSKLNPQQIEQPIRWINEEKGIEITDNGTVRVHYNTVGSDGTNDYKEFNKQLDWITEAKISQDGKFEIIYNNDSVTVGRDDAGRAIKGDRYVTTLNWIDKVDFLDDGTVNFYNNTDHDIPAFTFAEKIKFIKDVTIETNAEGSNYEGTGDQRIHITYNNDETQAIGNPLNYVIESCISIPKPGYDDAPYSHLLVYYSDPEYRLANRDKWVRYPSTKVIDSYSADVDGNLTTPVYHVWDEWIDLGDVRGQAGGIHFLKDVQDASELVGPPEKMLINGEIASYAAGWCVTVTPPGASASQIMVYDYDDEAWYSIGMIDSSSVNPIYVIAKSRSGANQRPLAGDVDTLRANGIWLAAETAYFAE